MQAGFTLSAHRQCRVGNLVIPISMSQGKSWPETPQLCSRSWRFFARLPEHHCRLQMSWWCRALARGSWHNTPLRLAPCPSKWALTLADCRLCWTCSAGFWSSLLVLNCCNELVNLFEVTTHFLSAVVQKMRLCPWCLWHHAFLKFLFSRANIGLPGWWYHSLHRLSASAKRFRFLYFIVWLFDGPLLSLLARKRKRFVSLYRLIVHLGGCYTHTNVWTVHSHSGNFHSMVAILMRILYKFICLCIKRWDLPTDSWSLSFLMSCYLKFWTVTIHRWCKVLSMQHALSQFCQGPQNLMIPGCISF